MTNNWLFAHLYVDEVICYEDLRKTPITTKELMKNGLTKEDIQEYFSLIEKIYGILFINKGDGKDEKVQSIWMELLDFSVSHSLIPQHVKNNEIKNYKMFPPMFFWKFFHFHFIYFEGVFNPTYLFSLHDFRLSLELDLAWFCYTEYLQIRYDVWIDDRVREEAKKNNPNLSIEEEEKLPRYITRYDAEKKEFRKISKHEISQLYSLMDTDLDNLYEKIKEHYKKYPSRLWRNSFEISERIGFMAGLTELEREWFSETYYLSLELDWLETCYYEVEEIFERGFHDTIVQSFPEETLYVYKGRITCERNHHPIEQATAVLMDNNGNDIELNVNHCKSCQKFFMDYTVYQHYREKYGVILGDIRMLPNGEYSDNSLDLAEASPLRLCGYSVSQKDNLSAAERQSIIQYCIESGVMDKGSVVQLLKWFVNVNGAKTGNTLAYKKWCEDLDFALAYNTHRQQRYTIKQIKPYRKNQFYITRSSKSTTSYPSYITATHLHEKVKHKAFGIGTVTEESAERVTITFENGKTSKFTKEVFSNGMVKCLGDFGDT